MPLVESRYIMFRVTSEVQVGRMVITIANNIGNRSSHRRGLATLGLNVSGAKDLNLVVRKGKHQSPAVVPIDLDLRPALMGMYDLHSTEGADRNR